MKTEGEQKELFLMDKKAAKAVLKGEPHVLVRDVTQEQAWKEHAGVARTLMCLPLRGEGEILGTVSIFDKFPHKTFFLPRSPRKTSSRSESSSGTRRRR